MTLESIDMERLRNELKDALGVELPQLDELREEVRKLHVQELSYRQCYAIAPVATDGGENRLTFDPINIEIVRVADSDGVERFQKILPLSGGADVIRDAFNPRSPNRVPLLVGFLDRLDVKYSELSYVLEAGTAGGDIRSAVRPFRDIAEWAVLLDIAWKPGKPTTLVLRDGLLRTKAIALDVMPKLKKCFEDAYRETGSLLVGVAKRSKVLNYLSLALHLEGTFNKKYPCFCQVPQELEAEAYNWARTWMEGHAFGKMHLVKLAEHPDALVLPVDVPDWLVSRRKELLEYLAETAKASFPTVGYPEPLIRAHENAVLHGLEMSVFEDMMLDELFNTQSEADRDKTIEHVSLGKGLQVGGWKEYG